MKEWGYREGFPDFRYVRGRNETRLPLFNTNIALPLPFCGNAAKNAALGASASLGVGAGALLAMEAAEAHSMATRNLSDIF